MTDIDGTWPQSTSKYATFNDTRSPERFQLSTCNQYVTFLHPPVLVWFQGRVAMQWFVEVKKLQIQGRQQLCKQKEKLLLQKENLQEMFFLKQYCMLLCVMYVTVWHIARYLFECQHDRSP